MNLHASRVAEALNDLSEHTGGTIVFPYDLVKDQKFRSSFGRMTLMDALSTLLNDAEH